MPRQLPQRHSLIAQAAEILRVEIDAGTWKEFLPGERELSAQLAISRPTLRAALELLQREGRLDVAQGHRRRILQVRKARRALAQSDKVVLLSPLPLHRLPPFVMFWIDDLRQRLADAKLNLHLHVSQTAHSTHPERHLKALTNEMRAAAWLLLLSNEPMQRWFDRNNLPCLITGSRFAGVSLPSIDLDSKAVCRHAAAILASKGHRRIALVLPKASTAGDQSSEAGFFEALKSSSPEPVGIVVRHDETVNDLCRKIDSVTKGANMITAMIVARSGHALTAFSYLRQRGLRIPEDCAMISRDNDEFLNFVVPKITRYACDPALFARRVSRLVLTLAQEKTLKAHQHFLIPELIKGETT